jgi:hypothetical protein
MSSFRAELEPRLGIPLDYRINTGRGSPSTDPRRWTHHYDASGDTGVPTEETLWICSIASAFHSGFHHPIANALYRVRQFLAGHEIRGSTRFAVQD